MLMIILWMPDNNDQSMCVLTILEKLKQTRLKFSQGSVTVL